MLYKRKRPDGTYGKIWWTRFSIGKREIRVTSGTDRKASAEEFERRLRDQIWREQSLGEVLHTWEEAKERWLKDKAHKRSLKRDELAFATIEKQLAGLALIDIDDQKVQEIEQAIANGRKHGTVVRTMAVLRGVLRRAEKRWKWIDKAPEFENVKQEKAAPRWITPKQFEQLCAELPPHARPMARFAVAVGPRSGNLFGLQWDAVDLESRVFRVDSGDFKGKRDVGFPLSAEAVRILEGQQGLHDRYVFVDQRGRAPVRSIKTCWKKACKRAGIEGFRFHDLRHTFAAWHKLAGTPALALKELGGWSDIRMVDRYGHINPTDYVQYVDNRRTKSGTGESEKD